LQHVTAGQKTMKYIPVYLLLLLASATAHAARWVAHPDKSQLTFTATQEGAGFKGVFESFNAGLEFDPTAPDGGSINVVIQLGSVNTEYQERDDYLAQDEWFHTELWPQAGYVASSFRHVGSNIYTADGMLTLRNISKAVQIEFTLLVDELGENAVMVGSGKLNRLDFGVGQGDWQDTSWVGDVVNINFELQLLRAYE
jgi:polyisoprenoid-binding protein YceI